MAAVECEGIGVIGGNRGMGGYWGGSRYMGGSGV